jgi:hypothetical protein
MTMQHKSLEDEILFLLGRSSTPLDVGQLYERVELADEIKQVSNAIYRMKATKKIAPTAFEGRRAYKLADGVAAPAPAGKAGRPTDAAPAAAPLGDVVGLPGDTSVVVGAAGKATLADTDQAILRAGAAAAADRVLGKADKHKASRGDESLADAIIAKLRKQLSKQAIPSELLESSPAPIIHIHIEQVDIHLGGL